MTMDNEQEKNLAMLESLMNRAIGLHGEMITLLDRKREAMRRSDTNVMTELCRLENDKVRLISELEKQRLTLIARLTLMVKPDARSPMRLGELAEQLPEPRRGHLLVLRKQLFERMTEVKGRTSVARKAAESLVKHMHGLIQNIGAITTGVSTYSEKGALPKNATAIRTINVTA